MNPTPATERIEIALVLDTWTWIEYWKGDDRVRTYIERKETRITSMITIAELERFYGVERERMDRMVSMIRSRSLLVPVDLVIARTAGSVRRQMKEGGIADAIIYATALRHRAKVVTGDPHFRGMPEVVFVGQS
ncbi:MULTISPECIES: PIN domain-containing protein [unclassified Methanoregula]|uniref:PIN domain-containing protein n=1 Tax=unclassified Methanoregula TaxID=2649730 RepID=UPI0025EE2360|nr:MULTISPECIES: PIN domain-containing protein [unclassified Methanoregula]